MTEFIVGVVAGAMVGILIMCLLVANGRDD